MTLDPAGALWWAAEETLVVSDLHLEKGSARARRGALLPPYDTETTLARLAGLVAAYAPGRVVCLGDSFHDRQAHARLSGNAHATLAELQRGREWIWISGNHDGDVPPEAGGRATDALRLRTLEFRHEPRPCPAPGEVAGHLHPAARLRLRGRAMRKRCFVTDGERLVMPAFGAFAGGLNVLDAAWRPHFPAGAFGVWVLGGRGVYGFSARHLVPDGT